MRLCLASQQIDDIRTGVGMYANSLVPAVAAAGHEVTLVGRGGVPAWPGVTQHAVPRVAGDPTPEGWLSFAWGAARRLRALRGFDCVHFLDAREAVFAAKRPGVPLLGTQHDCYLADAPASPRYWRQRYTDWVRRWAYHRVARRLERRALCRLDAIVANSDYVRARITAAYGLGPAVSRTIRYGFAFPWPPRDGAAGRPNVLFVGANLQRKGLPTLLRALARIRPHVPAVRLDVVGDHPARGAMAALADELGLAAQVTFRGFLPHDALAPLYREAAVLTLPSEVEGFGITLLEAMHTGVPVIGTTRGGSAELVRDGWNGLLVEPGDVEALAEALRLLLTDAARRAELGAHGRETAARFTLERMVGETLAAYAAARERA